MIFIFESDFWKSQGMMSKVLTFDKLIKFIHPECRDEVEENWRKISLIRKVAVQVRCDFNGKGYQWWEFRYKTIALPDGGYKAAGLLLNIQDIKDHEHELEEARLLAEKAELKQSFLANMSHEIRTPLNAIVGFSALLAATEDMAEKELYNSLISHNNELLLELINDVLDLSKLESGYLELHPSWFNLAELLDESVAEYTRQLAAGVELRTHYLDQGFLVELDRLRIKQILNNFLSNALKNTTSGYVEVFYEIDSSYVRIGVKDTGRGIPQNMLEKIFERFEKVDSFTQGAGLGLPICKSIVDKMNGRIWADSQLGIGTTFMVELPCSVTPIDA